MYTIIVPDAKKWPMLKNFTTLIQCPPAAVWPKFFYNDGNFELASRLCYIIYYIVSVYVYIFQVDSRNSRNALVDNVFDPTPLLTDLTCCKL